MSQNPLSFDVTDETVSALERALLGGPLKSVVGSNPSCKIIKLSPGGWYSKTDQLDRFVCTHDLPQDTSIFDARSRFNDEQKGIYHCGLVIVFPGDRSWPTQYPEISDHMRGVRKFIKRQDVFDIIRGPIYALITYGIQANIAVTE